MNFDFYAMFSGQNKTVHLSSAANYGLSTADYMNVGKKVSGKKVSGKKVSEKKNPEKKYQEKK